MNPNQYTSDNVGIEFMLPALQYNLADALGGGGALLTGIMMKQIFYLQGTTQYNSYTFSPSDPSNDGLWADLYVDCMNMGHVLSLRAQKDGATAYEAVAKIHQAAALGIATCVWGDVPFSECFDPGESVFPRFDRQEVIYDTLQRMLDYSIDLLQSPKGRKPSTDDLVYSGNLSKWIRAAYSLKARFYLHLVKLDVGYYDSAALALSSAMTSNDDNFVFKFEAGVAANNAPLYGLRGNLNSQVDSAFDNKLKAISDPRKDFFYTTKGSVFSGTRFFYGPFYSSPGSDFPIITFEECEFMRAEIALSKTMWPGPKTISKVLFGHRSVVLRLSTVALLRMKTWQQLPAGPPWILMSRHRAISRTLARSRCTSASFCSGTSRFFCNWNYGMTIVEVSYIQRARACPICRPERATRYPEGTSIPARSFQEIPMRPKPFPVYLTGCGGMFKNESFNI
ncbi:MAG: SusD/RagB family nutrient-binding outer membrane lipoprotein [Cytophagales bacterium]|nr:SusD/RagB family nutrient-binding outer membrane lipoprotein [Cytophagales bacterium]